MAIKGTQEIEADSTTESEKVQGETSTAALYSSVVEELQFDSPRREIPSLNLKDVEVRSKLGSGSFSEVFSVTILLDSFYNGVGEDPTEAGSLSDCDLSPLEVSNSQLIRKMSSTLSAAGPKYAIKTLRKDFEREKGMIPLAVRDAFYEAEILSHLSPHPHIVSLVAISNGFLQDPTQGFLIMERVQETLKHRLARWSRNSKNAKKTSCFQFVKRRREMLHDQRSRIELCGVGLARAFKFLHKHGIVYRDLKPANIGFGYDGLVKLFDFGLARRHVPLRDQPRRLTGDAGTARYMAPEVSLHEEYSLPADVHSYAIQLWEICTLERPYENCPSLDKLKERAVSSNTRPSLRKIACPKVRELLKACWDPEPRQRPTFTVILKELEAIAGLTERPRGS